MSIVAYTDLRGITRRSDCVRTLVSLDGDRMLWLACGLADLFGSHEKGSWVLKAHLTEGVTDFEHDSAYAFQLPLIGLTFQHTSAHTSTFRAWIDPENSDAFRVPLLGYNPVKDPKMVLCKSKNCAQVHPIVPHFMPPFNEKLWRAVAGKRVEVAMGPVWPKD